MKKIFMMFMAVAMSAAMVACNDENTPSDSANSVASVTLDQPTLTMAVGEKKSLVVTVLPATADDKSVTWESGDEAIATVSSTGEVEAKSTGKVTITVTSVANKKKTAKCEVTVTGGEVPVTYVMPAAFGALNDGLDYYVEYTLTAGKISNMEMSCMDYDADQETIVSFEVTYPAANQCIVKFEAFGTPVVATYTLNADGYALSCDAIWDDPADPGTYGKATFEYDAATKMLKKVTDGDNEKVFESTYEGTEAKTIFGANFGLLNVLSGEIMNNCAIDPSYLFMGSISTQPSVFTLAAMCNLLPHSKFIPASVESVEEGASLDIETFVNEAGKLEIFEIPGEDGPFFSLMFEY